MYWRNCRAASKVVDPLASQIASRPACGHTAGSAQTCWPRAVRAPADSRVQVDCRVEQPPADKVQHALRHRRLIQQEPSAGQVLVQLGHVLPVMFERRIEQIDDPDRAVAVDHHVLQRQIAVTERRRQRRRTPARDPAPETIASGYPEEIDPWSAVRRKLGVQASNRLAQPCAARQRRPLGGSLQIVAQPSRRTARPRRTRRGAGSWRRPVRGQIPCRSRIGRRLLPRRESRACASGRPSRHANAACLRACAAETRTAAGIAGRLAHDPVPAVLGQAGTPAAPDRPDNCRTSAASAARRSSRCSFHDRSSARSYRLSATCRSADVKHLHAGRFGARHAGISVFEHQARVGSNLQTARPPPKTSRATACPAGHLRP